jgi:hypothetical protein
MVNMRHRINRGNIDQEVHENIQVSSYVSQLLPSDYSHQRLTEDVAKCFRQCAISRSTEQRCYNSRIDTVTIPYIHRLARQIHVAWYV